MPVYSSPIRRRIAAADGLLRRMHGVAPATRSPPESPPSSLSEPDEGLVRGLMRVNHSGEICAQALYLGQSLLARDPELILFLREAAAEEQDHMAWCLRRLNALRSGPSRLAPLWYGGAMLIGALAALAGDRTSLGFLSETERQVAEHLRGHIDRLPPEDHESRAILGQMLREELQHKDAAGSRGAATLPPPVRTLMRMTAKVMTTVAYYV